MEVKKEPSAKEKEINGMKKFLGKKGYITTYIESVIPKTELKYTKNNPFVLLKNIINKIYKGSDGIKKKVVLMDKWGFGKGYLEKLKKIENKITNTTNKNAASIVLKTRSLKVRNLYNKAALMNPLYTNMNIKRIAGYVGKRLEGKKYTRKDVTEFENLNNKTRLKIGGIRRRKFKIKMRRIPKASNILNRPVRKS